MADNVGITPGTGATVAADDIGGVLHQRVKLGLGADGTAVDAVAGAGVVSTGTQRVTLASDDPAVAGLGAIGDAAWASGNGTHTAILKTIATAALDTSAVDVNLQAGTNIVGAVRIASAEYETVAASQTDQMMGPTGAVGDKIEGILVIPATLSPGAISIEDGATNTTVFTGGTASVPSLIPFFIPLLNIASVSGGWEITTGANVSCIVFGDFT